MQTFSYSENIPNISQFCGKRAAQALSSGAKAERGMVVNEPNKMMIASVGQRVKQARLAKALRLSDLARECGISVPTLSKFENGHISLNFRHLVEIALALNVPVSHFMSTPAIAPVTGRRAVTRKGEGLLQTTGRIDFEVLCDDLAQRHNVFWKARVKARSLEEFGDFSSHPGEEFILVLSGEIMLHTEAYKPLYLAEGDSVHFDGMSPHAYIAVSEQTPVILISNTVEDGISSVTEEGRDERSMSGDEGD